MKKKRAKYRARLDSGSSEETPAQTEVRLRVVEAQLAKLRELMDVTAERTIDRLRSMKSDSRSVLNEYLEHEKDESGIANLKIKYNKVFGYFIEISKAHLDRVPEDYERRQTLTNAERFITPELKELESKILEAEELSNNRERELYAELLDELSGHARRIAGTAGVVAQMDVLNAFADRARRWNYCRPEVGEEPGIFISEGRHPVLEQVQRDPPFIPNDTELDPSGSRIVLLDYNCRPVRLLGLVMLAQGHVDVTQAFVIDRMARRFGCQCVVVGIDSQGGENDYQVASHTGDPERTRYGRRSTVEWVREVQDRGAGEREDADRAGGCDCDVAAGPARPRHRCRQQQARPFREREWRDCFF